MMAWNRIETVELVKMGIFCMCLKDKPTKFTARWVMANERKEVRNDFIVGNQVTGKMELLFIETG